MVQVADRVATRPEPEPARPEQQTEPAVVLQPYSLIFVGLIVVGFLLRIHRLGERALHHDESLHTLYSWYLYSGRGYIHDPMMHGPWQFHWTALIYFLFGDSDFTGRLAPVLLGTALIGLPYFLRHELGATGAVITAILLTLSAPFLYFSRFAREDIYAVTWTMVIVVGLFGAIRTHQPRWFYLAALGFAGAFMTKETIYITSAIFLATLAVIGTLFRGTRVGQEFVAAFVSFPPSVWLKATALVVGLCAVFFTTFFTNVGEPWKCLDSNLATTLANFQSQSRKCPAGGLLSGTVGALAYWLEQHGVQRGNQPWFYYLLLLPLYDTFTVALATVGSIFWLRGRRNLLFWFSLAWGVGGLCIYSYAGEKMPWLTVHLSLPLTMLAGMSLGAWLERLDLRRLRQSPTLWAWGLSLLALSTASAAVALNAVQALTQLERQSWLLERLGMLAVLAGVVAGLVYIRSRYRDALVGPAVGLAIIIALAVFHVHSSWEVTYAHGDIPVEMLVYVQSSPDVPLVVQELERLGFQTGQGKDLRILMDNGYSERGEVHEAISWPFEWYLRDYRNKRYFSKTFAPDINPADYPAILVMAPNLEPIRDKLADFNGQKYRLNWWYPEDYKGLSPQVIWDGLRDPETRARVLQYILYREPLNPLGAREFYFFVRKDIPALGPAPGAVRAASVPRPPTTAPRVATLIARPDGSAIFGRAADGSSLLVEPKGVAAGPDGRLYVVESGAHRITAFDPEGTIALSFGRQGSNDGEFNEPWGIAVAPSGEIFVADTWNHRIQKFDASGKFLKKWGGFADTRGQVDQRTGQFWGPRDIALGPDNMLYVVDTGNKRIQVFDTEGRFQRAFGGEGTEPGKLREPVGLAFSGSDLLVADTWNGRIQRLDTTGRALAQYPVTGWEGQSVINKPFLAADPQGRILASLPNSGNLIVFNPDGGQASALSIAAAGGLPQARAIGVAFAPAGEAFVADSQNGVVVRLMIR